jgi:NDP-sugar pyrophosphorylase family protein
MQCVILAGGLGTRIAAYAPALPKALIPIHGEPFAHHQLTLLSRRGVRRVVYCVGHKGDLIRQFVGGGERWGLEVTYVDEGTQLRGTAGALRLALDSGALAPSFFVLYGDSYLPIEYRAVWAAFEACGKAGLMTVFRNDHRWDTSNVLFERGQVILYDKRRLDARANEMIYIDYGLAVLRAEALDRQVPAGAFEDLADVYHRLSIAGELAGFEVNERFYEIGSPAGIEDFRCYLAVRGSGAAAGGDARTERTRG